MRHVKGFSNSTKIRYIVNGFGMFGTVGDLFTKTATVSHGLALRKAIEMLAHQRCTGDARPVGIGIQHNGIDIQIDLMG